MKWLSNRDNRFDLILTLVFGVLSAISLYHHEMWRDELQVWSLVRESHSIHDLFINLKYEGHPALWYLLLMPLARLTPKPYPMQLLHLSVAIASVHIFVRHSPFGRMVKVLFPFGYFILYEYAVISRNYGIGVLLVLLICVFFRERFKKFHIVGLLLFLLAHTSVYGLIIAISFASGILIEYIIKSGGTGSSEYKREILAGSTIIGLGVFTSILQMSPPVDSSFAPKWILTYDFTRFKDVIGTVTNAFIPIPPIELHFWNSSIFDGLTWLLLSKGIIASLVISWATLLLVRKPVALFIYIIGTVGLLTFFYVKYLGYIRHHGFLFILFLACLWVSSYYEDSQADWLVMRASNVLRKGLQLQLAAILIVHLLGGGIAFAMDYMYPFSQSMRMAKLLVVPGMKDRVWVADLDDAVSSVSGYADNKFLYVRGNRFGSFVRWDSVRVKHVSQEDVVKTAREQLLKLNKVGIIVSYPLSEEVISLNGLREVIRLKPGIVKDEGYCVYLIEDALKATKE